LIYNGETLNYEFMYNSAETAALHEYLNGNENVNIHDIRRVALWKLDRVLEIPPETITELRLVVRTEALEIDDDLARRALESLVACHGVGYPMATTILKFLRPDVFPIIDVRAYRALTGTRLRAHQYSYPLYLDYAARVKDIAAEQNRPLREVDEQLYCYDKEHNGPI